MFLSAVTNIILFLPTSTMWFPSYVSKIIFIPSRSNPKAFVLGVIFIMILIRLSSNNPSIEIAGVPVGVGVSSGVGVGVSLGVVVSDIVGVGDGWVTVIVGVGDGWVIVIVGVYVSDIVGVGDG